MRLSYNLSLFTLIAFTITAINEEVVEL